MTIQSAAQMAIDVQDACNLSGVVFSFAEVMQVICDEANRLGKGTDWRNSHPIAQLFADKIADMSRSKYDEYETFSKAYDACKQIAAGTSQGSTS